jgi:hypothetical protein
MNLRRLILSTLFIVSPLIGLAQSNGPVTSIDNPGGGSIAYAQLPLQHTVQGAMGKVLQYASQRFGARPQVDRVMKSPDGNSLALTFTVKPPNGGQEITGLALVAVSESKPGAGAVLSDQSDRFRTTIKPMLKRLQQEAIAKGGGGSAQASASASSASNSSGSASAGPASTSAAKTSASPPAPSAPAAALRQTPFPDGSGAIGLPDGWRITSAHAGDVIAQGPHGEGVRFGMPVSVLDPRNAQSQALGHGPGGTAPGNFVYIPFGTDGATAFKSAITQFSQKQRKPPPTIDYTAVKELPNDGKGGRNYFLVANVDAHDGKGPVVAWMQVGIGVPLALGGYQMIFCQVTVPAAQADQEAATVGKIFGSYQLNAAVAGGEIQADTQLTTRIFQSTMGTIRHAEDVSDRETQATSDYLRGNTVIRDTELNGHGRVSDDVADALVHADPNRYEVVPPSQYIQGIDY